MHTNTRAKSHRSFTVNRRSRVPSRMHRMRVHSGRTVSRCECTYVYVYSAAKLAPRPACVLPGTLETTNAVASSMPAPGMSLSMICSSRTNLPRASRHFERSKAPAMIAGCIGNIENRRATPIYLRISDISRSRKHPTDRSC